MNPLEQALAFLAQRNIDPATVIPMRRTANIIPMRESYPIVCFYVNSAQTQHYEQPQDNDFQI